MKIKHSFDSLPSSLHLFCNTLFKYLYRNSLTNFPVSLLFFPTHFTKLAVCLDMKNKQHWGNRLVPCTLGGPELQKQSAQHSIQIIITIDQTPSSVLSKTICMYGHTMFLLLKLFNYMSWYICTQYSGRLTSFQYNIEKKLE